MEEYKDALYRTDPDTYYNLDPGDLTKAFEVKKRLQCKPFKYYLEVIAPDLVEHFPPFDKPVFASGAISSVLDPSKCITYVGPEPASPMKLRQCSANVTIPSENQYFDFTWHCNIKHHSKDRNKKNCIDKVAVNMYYCHFDFGNQFWKYDLVSENGWNLKQIIQNIDAQIIFIFFRKPTNCKILRPILV